MEIVLKYIVGIPIQTGNFLFPIQNPRPRLLEKNCSPRLEFSLDPRWKRLFSKTDKCFLQDFKKNTELLLDLTCDW